uniref:Nose resistant-to-fluoxetine protein N-terminal domain-containing protein n=1 Tax=Timema monikensis TaxID=170555 RepID=A0A7R9EJ65_9NEOP|nr:unnamed protein product [Timema monikensis]
MPSPEVRISVWDVAEKSTFLMLTGHTQQQDVYRHARGLTTQHHVVVATQITTHAPAHESTPRQRLAGDQRKRRGAVADRTSDGQLELTRLDDLSFHFLHPSYDGARCGHAARTALGPPLARVALLGELKLRWSLCIPSSCRADDLQVRLDALLHILKLPIRATVQNEDCHIAKKTPFNATDLVTM